MLSTNRKTQNALIAGSLILFVIAGFYLVRVQPLRADDPPPTVLSSESEPVRGVFEGVTPCEGLVLPQIPENTDCEQMIWKLTLYQDGGDPTTYKLTSAYGLSQQGTPGLQGGGTPLDLEGNWAEIRGTADNPDAVVYQLNPDDLPNAGHFVKLDDNILHLLTPDKSLMIGNAAWSYTLNRTDKRIVSAPSTSDSPIPPTPLADLAIEAADTGVFEGRIPCAEMVIALHDLSASGCQRVKLQLTLLATNDSATYELVSIYVGTGNTVYRASGTWEILQDTAANGQIYQLNTEDSQRPLLLLKVDKNHLFFLDADFNLMVGDAALSFTLSRAE